MIRKLLSITAALLVLSMPAQSQGTADSVFVRAQKMVSDGNAGRGRSVVDSVLRSSRRGSPAYAEALFWRATLAATSQQSEQDYRRLVVEYPLYARTGDVLLRLAQLELLRGNRDAAAVHLRRIQTEHPEFGNQAAASYWLGRVLFEKNDLAGACGAIADAKRIVKPDDVELANQIEYQNQQCAGVVISAPDTTRLAEVTSGPLAGPLPGPVTRAPAPATGNLPPPLPANSSGSYSVQIAAYSEKTQATALVSRLSSRGFSARVDGSRAPYRVRIGQYATRADAVAAQQRIKKGGITGIVVKVD
ncbi:MAG: SPOR domain-containing protein [Gemmatimonadaceae bacterium]|nr:SPOR domain-containing protein [Gemmatimonadaceae bacterium]